jgi:hypothetical protein
MIWDIGFEISDKKPITYLITHILYLRSLLNSTAYFLLYYILLPLIFLFF